MFRLPVLRTACLALALLAGSLPVLAGSFSVFPIRADLGSAKQVASLTVRNTGDEPATIQLQAMSWRQQDGLDSLESTRELLATPPIFTVQAGGSQIVRVGLRRAPDADMELSYRLLLREVPSEPKPGFAGLRVALELSVPVFVAPLSGKAAPNLQWALVEAGDGPRLRVNNAGNGHVRIGSVILAAPSGEAIGPVDVSAYVLPGQARELSLPRRPAPVGGLRVNARTGHGELAADLAGGPAPR